MIYSDYIVPKINATISSCPLRKLGVAAKESFGLSSCYLTLTSFLNQFLVLLSNLLSCGKYYNLSQQFLSKAPDPALLFSNIECNDN